MFRRASQPQNRTKATRVVVAQQRAIGKHDVHMVVLARCGRVALPNPQAAGHAQMNQQHARIKTNQQIFGAAAAFAHDKMAQGFRQRGRDLPAQLGLADGYGGDGLVEDMRGDAAQGGFYFGEFGHGGGGVWFEEGDYKGTSRLKMRFDDFQAAFAF